MDDAAVAVAAAVAAAVVAALHEDEEDDDAWTVKNGVESSYPLVPLGREVGVPLDYHAPLQWMNDEETYLKARYLSCV
jgi:hypothetical protein